MDKTLTPTEVAKELGCHDSTLRKYCLLLESEGFTFKRNAKNSRQYTESDVITLQRMITLVKTDGVTVENAAYTVAKVGMGVNASVDETAVTDNGGERYHSDITPLLINEIQELKKEIQQQREVIDGFRVSQDKRDTYFIEILEKLQGEITELNRVALLPEPTDVEKPKKNLFSRIFNK